MESHPVVTVNNSKQRCSLHLQNRREQAGGKERNCRKNVSGFASLFIRQKAKQDHQRHSIDYSKWQSCKDKEIQMLSRISRSIQPKLIKKRKKNNGSDSDSGGTLAEEGRKGGEERRDAALIGWSNCAPAALGIVWTSSIESREREGKASRPSTTGLRHGTSLRVDCGNCIGFQLFWLQSAHTLQSAHSWPSPWRRKVIVSWAGRPFISPHWFNTHSIITASTLPFLWIRTRAVVVVDSILGVGRSILTLHDYSALSTTM